MSFPSVIDEVLPSSLNSCRANFALIQYVHPFFHTKITLVVQIPCVKRRLQRESRVYRVHHPALHLCPGSRNLGSALPPTDEKPAARVFGDLTKRDAGRPRCRTQVSSSSVWGFLSLCPRQFTAPPSLIRS